MHGGRAHASIELANRRVYAKTLAPIQPRTYAHTITILWSQIHRAASIPTSRTLALLAAYAGSVALVLGTP